MSKKRERIILEEGKRLSQSLLWELQTAAYSQYSVAAWREKGVPHYITSNPYIARRYALMVAAYLEDIRDTISSDAPVYIFDLGAGTGRFGYLFLKAFIPLCERFHFDFKIRYVMTDMVEGNIAFWRGHERLKPFCDKGQLDFACYTAGESTEMHLLLSGEKVSRDSTVNPSIVIANYFFDTISQDLFRCENGKLYEGRVTLYGEGEKGCDVRDPALIPTLSCDYDYSHEVKGEGYYDDEGLNAVLQWHMETFDVATFMLPVGGIRMLRDFQRHVSSRFLLLAGDQGVCTEEQVQRWGDPAVSLHGTFSIPVSYYALSYDIQRSGGEVFLTSHPVHTFVNMAAVSYGSEGGFHRLAHAFKEHVEAFEPYDYWELVNGFEAVIPSLSVAQILAVLKLGGWDPADFCIVFERLRGHIAVAPYDVQQRAVEAVYHLWENLYSLSHEESDVILNLGVILFEIKRYDEALVFFKRAYQHSSDNAAAYFNSGMCYFFLGEREKAAEAFASAEAIDPSYIVN
jgi:tetratricopeptide (TPR) repeat protein